MKEVISYSRFSTCGWYKVHFEQRVWGGEALLPYNILHSTYIHLILKVNFLHSSWHLRWVCVCLMHFWHCSLPQPATWLHRLPHLLHVCSVSVDQNPNPTIFMARKFYWFREYIQTEDILTDIFHILTCSCLNWTFVTTPIRILLWYCYDYK